MRSFTNLRPHQQHLLIGTLLVGGIMAFSTAAAHAGTTGTEFKAAYDMLSNWLKGYLGKTIAIAFLLVGLFMGIARQSIIAAGVALAVAFVILLLPTILNSLLSATVSPHTVAVVSAPVTGPVLPHVVLPVAGPAFPMAVAH